MGIGIIFFLKYCLFRIFLIEKTRKYTFKIKYVIPGIF